jgi:hypothetical protein
MGNAQVTVCNDLQASVEVMSYNDGDHVYWIAKEDKKIEPGCKNTLCSAGQSIVKLRAIYQSREYGPFVAYDGNSYAASDIFGIKGAKYFPKTHFHIAEVAEEGNPTVTREVHDQAGVPICWAYTAATLVRAAQARSGKRRTPHKNIVNYLSDKHGKKGNFTNLILPDVMERYDFHCIVTPIDLGQAVMIAFPTKRPLLLHMYLTDRQWKKFHDFFDEGRDTRREVFCAADLNDGTSFISPDEKYQGHAVTVIGVLPYLTHNRENGFCFLIKNSWGAAWGKDGLCQIDRDTFPLFKRYGFYDVKVETDSP